MFFHLSNLICIIRYWVRLLD